jgi:class 3 adenylate cyclase
MRVERTFAFFDLCGFTSFTEMHGDAAAVAVVAELRTTLQYLSKTCSGVEIVKWLGDGAMLSGTNADAIIMCALEARERTATTGPLALRGGIAWGAAFVLDGPDYVGASVNLAARLCCAASANRLLVLASLVAETRPGRIAFKASTDVLLDGIGRVPIAEPITIVPARSKWTGPQAPTAQPCQAQLSTPVPGSEPPSVAACSGLGLEAGVA